MNEFLSIVVISYETPRELPRTLYSLSPHFQQGIAAEDYEVIVVDNGSRRPPEATDFTDLGIDLTVLHVDQPTSSPCRAVNLGLDSSCGAAVGVFIDGARLASPGLLRRAREALSLDPRAVVGSRGRYLGPMMQRHSMRFGYDRDVEDGLLERIDWKHNGYDLFKISVFDEVSGPGWHGQVGESNSLFMRRGLWRELGGYDEAFVSPGGGFVNLDTWERACHLPDVSPILLIGEATFHQFHGGVATNVPRKDVKTLRREYIELRGHDHTRPKVPVSVWGSFVVTPPPDEIGRHEVTPADRMHDGPMKDLLDLGAPRVVPVPSDRRAALARQLRRLWRRVPPPVRRAVDSLRRR